MRIGFLHSIITVRYEHRSDEWKCRFPNPAEQLYSAQFLRSIRPHSSSIDLSCTCLPQAAELNKILAARSCRFARIPPSIHQRIRSIHSQLDGPSSNSMSGFTARYIGLSSAIVGLITCRRSAHLRTSYLF